MAVPQNKKSRSRTRMLRSRVFLRTPVLCEEIGGVRGEKKGGGALRRRHHIGPDGIYRGQRYFAPKTDLIESDED